MNVCFLFLYYSVLIYISCIRWHVERQKRSRYPCKAINLRKYKALDELVERFVFIESQSICVPLSVWVSPKLRGLTLQLGLYLFIYYYYYYNYYWPNIASKKEKPLFNSWSQNYFFFLAKQNKPKFTIRKWSSKKKHNLEPLWIYWFT